MLDAQVGNNEKNKNSEMIERINQIGTLEELNDMLSYFRKMEINNLTWKKCLLDKSLAIGAVYNQECECFERKVDPQILVA
jgi:hypothetical protein